jgi:hypothetical protein
MCGLILAGAPAFGQSGRKQKKSTPEPPVQGVSQPQTTEKAEPEPAAKSKEKGTAILVATAMPEIGISVTMTHIAREACISELRRIPTLEVREARDQNRVDAINAAKRDDRTAVVFMEFRTQAFASSSPSQWELELLYTLFEPKTGKVIGSGVGYPVTPNDRLPAPPIGVRREERLVELAAREVARQVLKKLNLRSGP